MDDNNHAVGPRGVEDQNSNGLERRWCLPDGNLLARAEPVLPLRNDGRCNVLVDGVLCDYSNDFDELMLNPAENAARRRRHAAHLGQGRTRATAASGPGPHRSRPEESIPGHRPLTDLGNEERFVKQHSEDVRWCPRLRTFFVWDGSRWREDEGDAEAIMRAGQTVRSIYGEALLPGDSALRMKLSKHAVQSESAQRIEAMLKLARAHLAIPPEAFDADPLLLNVSNGTLDLRTGGLKRHDRGNLCCKLAPVAFDAEARAPLFDAFLHRILADSAPLVDFVRRMLGYLLTGAVSEQVMFFAHGLGANGKSTLLGVIQSLMGDYGLQAPQSLLLARKHEPHPAEQAQLRGKRLAVCIEVERGMRFNESLVKHLTGGDPINARGLYQDFFTFLPTHKLVLAANDKPIVRGTDEAIWRRVLTIPFEVTIPPSERDPHLKEKLLREAPGILAFAVRGCLEWQKDGLKPPPEVSAATAAYRREMDTFADFVAEECVEAPVARVSKKHLFECYSVWCERNRMMLPFGKIAFGRAIALRGHSDVTIGHDKDRGWSGIGLRAACDRIAADKTNNPSDDFQSDKPERVGGREVRNVRGGTFAALQANEGGKP